jgi:hypothetical protein
MAGFVPSNRAEGVTQSVRTRKRFARSESRVRILHTGVRMHAVTSLRGIQMGEAHQPATREAHGRRCTMRVGATWETAKVGVQHTAIPRLCVRSAPSQRYSGGNASGGAAIR